MAEIQLDPDVHGCKQFIIHPCPCGNMDYAKADYTSIHGKIASGWKRDGDALTLTVTVPTNTTATVYVPADEGAQIIESGKPAENAEGVNFIKRENGFAVYAVGSGTYRFASTLSQ